jgi:hypothetical protein
MWLDRLINYLRGYRPSKPRDVMMKELPPLLEHFKDAHLMFITAHTWDDKDYELEEAKEQLEFGIQQMEGYIKQGGYIINE